MKRFWIAFVTVLCMLCCIPVLPASAAGVVLYDEGNRLTAEENSKAVKRFQAVSDRTNLNIIVILSPIAYSDETIEAATSTVYDGTYGQKTDGVCLYIDLSSQAHPYDYLMTSGLGQFYYTNSQDSHRVDSILYAFEKYLYPKGSEDVAGALEEFASQLEYYYEAGIPDHYYVYDDVYHEYYHVENGQVITTRNKPYINRTMVVFMGLVGLLFGLIVSAIVSGAVKSKYQFRHELTPTNYVNKKTVRYRQQYDNFVNTRTTKTPISTDSGRSGGGGHSDGGHSSGGHGGGGHHR